MSRTPGTLVAANVTKSHGAQLVLSGVGLVVPPGARIGLVGPNGVGKSTLLRILGGLEEPDSGTVRRSPPDLAVGYLPQEADAARAGGVCAELGLDVPLDADLGRLSGGQAARARLAALLLSRFDVFLLDEPTNDLDFDGLERLERFVRELDGAAVIVSHDRDFL